VGALGVSLFLIISGAAPTPTYRRAAGGLAGRRRPPPLTARAAG